MLPEKTKRTEETLWSCPLRVFKQSKELKFHILMDKSAEQLANKSPSLLKVISFIVTNIC
jgi:hypothetical protein